MSNGVASRQNRKSFRFILQNICGIDRAVFFTLLYKSWQLFSAPITLWLVITIFSPKIQGYYYTFSSLLLLQALLELGFGVVLVQFISHEWAHLSMTDAHEIQGDPKALDRLASLVRLAMQWYLVLSILFFIMVGIGGSLFLSQHQTGVDIQRPWWLLCTTVSFSIFLLPMRLFLDGSNRIDLTQKINLKASVAAAIAGWIAIYYGAELYTLSIISGVTVIITSLFLIRRFIPFYKISKQEDRGYSVSWKKEFWPQQWRIGLSWFSGFFMFQSFVPIMFQLHGPVVAGQMGASMQVYQAINGFSQAWPNAVGPRLGMLGAKKGMTALRVLVKHTYWRSLVASILFSAGAFWVIWMLHLYHLPQAERFASLSAIAILLFTLIAMQLSNIETLAIRFQKREPFVSVSLICAVMVFLSNIFIGYYYGIVGSMLGFLMVMLLILIPWVHRIYKREMHNFVAV